MKVFRDINNPQIPVLIKQGAVGVIPTDTLYGVVASASNKQAIERLYSIRHRNPLKACIVLVGTRRQIVDDEAWEPIHRYATEQYWPGPVSIVLPVTDKTPAYLTHGGETPPYRQPNYPALQAMLLQAGPVVAPSANPEGKPPATTVEEAQAYFGDSVDFYVDAGKLQGRPSTLVKAKAGKLVVLRQGTGIIKPQDLE